MSKILVIRFSALGDVAMTVPVIASFAQAYPSDEVVVLSQKNVAPLFEGLAGNVRFVSADLKGIHRGIAGLNRLYNDLKQENFDYVADLHSVLRTHWLRIRFAISGVKTAKINKGRTEKKRLTRRKNKIFQPLTSTFDRYRNVFRELGFDFGLTFQPQPSSSEQFELLFGAKQQQKWIGIAPFAKHTGKIYPLEYIENIIAHFNKNNTVRIFLFGGGETEKKIIAGWQTKYPDIVSVVGKFNLMDEIRLMGQLDLVLSMDSANMHLASLSGTPVVSVWGATHPYAGFLGWNQLIENTIQTDLPCRPCSVFGQQPCFRKDYACMQNIKPEQIISRIESVIQI